MDQNTKGNSPPSMGFAGAKSKPPHPGAKWRQIGVMLAVLLLTVVISANSPSVRGPATGLASVGDLCGHHYRYHHQAITHGRDRLVWNRGDGAYRDAHGIPQ